MDLLERNFEAAIAALAPVVFVAIKFSSNKYLTNESKPPAEGGSA